MTRLKNVETYNSLRSGGFKKKMSWVAERAKIEQNLNYGAVSCWQAAVEAVKDCCEDFNTNYDGAVTFSMNNGEVIVAVSRVGAAITMKFDSTKPAILVSVNKGNPRVFQISADEAGAFIKSFGSGQQRITADEFSREALEGTLFASKPTPRFASVRGV